MAAPCLRTVLTTLKGLNPPSPLSWFGTHPMSPYRLFHCRHGATRMSIKTEAHKAGVKNTFPQGVEYIPKKKAKNPMTKIGYAWIIGMPTGIIGFVLAKRQVDKNRLKQMKIRQRMKKANEGEYESPRYRALSRDE